MACSRNVDLSVCSDDVADLASRFFALFIACRCYSMWKIRLYENVSVSVVMMLQTWHLGFSHFLLPVDATVCGKLDLTRMFLKFVGCMYAQIGVTSNGCLDDGNLL